MHSDDDDDEAAPCFFGGDHLRPPAGADLQRLQTKLKNIPTLEGLLAEQDPHAMTDEQIDLAEKLAREMLASNPQSDDQMKVALKALMRKFKTDCKKSMLLQGFQRLKAKNAVPSQASPASIAFVERYLQFKAPRSQSGVLVVTVFTSAYPEDETGKKQTFSCKWNCYYCPNEPGQPRSYLLNEPGVRRANRLDFDPVRQFVDRVAALVSIGHPADKVELLVLGGTWESYPEIYRERFVRDLFYAANTFFDTLPKRDRLSLAEEQARNETAVCKIIGLTLETRPDTINPEMIVKLRQLGCTRVQVGVQHTDDSVLQVVNREATRGDVVRAIRLLKDSCFKVDIHLMPDLPSSSPEVDKKMFDDVLYSPDLQADQWKIYPCQTTPFSVIQKWYEDGRYRSYGIDALIDVILYAKRRVHPWIRLNRVIRDIPVEYVLEGCEVSNLRQLLQIKLERNGEWCKCIRCREVKGDKEIAEKLATSVIVVRNYDASRGREVFISVETPDERTIFGFLRLRLPPANAVTPFAELRGGETALIRELHVYGNLIAASPNAASGASSSSSSSSATPQSAAQHLGIGRRLLERAEDIAKRAGYKFVAVISGIGVRNYYRKRGYEVVDPGRGGFMLKPLLELGLSPGQLDTLLLKNAVAASGAKFEQALRASSPECQQDVASANQLIRHLSQERADSGESGAPFKWKQILIRLLLWVVAAILTRQCFVRYYNSNKFGETTMDF